MKTERQNVGRRGEDLACRYLEELGHNIICRNWRSSHLEIDIVTIEAGTLHFVEVKSRTAPCLAEPQDNVDFRKKLNLVHAVKAFIHSPICKRLPAGLEISIDVLTVIFDTDGGSVAYYPRAFIPLPDHRFF